MPLNMPLGGTNTRQGTYTGNGANDRQVTTGWKCGLVLIWQLTTPRFFITSGSQTTYCFAGVDATTVDINNTALLLHSSDGFVVDNLFANENAETYYYMAISAN